MSSKNLSLYFYWHSKNTFRPDLGKGEMVSCHKDRKWRKVVAQGPICNLNPQHDGDFTDLPRPLLPSALISDVGTASLVL